MSVGIVMNQMTLDYPSAMEEAFYAFHEQNPRVYELIIQFARQKKSQGFAHYGIKSIWERVRWEMPITTEGDEFKLNNNYTAFYARMVMRDCPDLRGFFRTRQQHGG